MEERRSKYKHHDTRHPHKESSGRRQNKSQIINVDTELDRVIAGPSKVIHDFEDKLKTTSSDRKNNETCRQCETTFQQIYELSDEFQTLRRKHLTICHHCRKSILSCQCKRCSHISEPYLPLLLVEQSEKDFFEVNYTNWAYKIKKTLMNMLKLHSPFSQGGYHQTSKLNKDFQKILRELWVCLSSQGSEMNKLFPLSDFIFNEVKEMLEDLLLQAQLPFVSRRIDSGRVDHSGMIDTPELEQSFLDETFRQHEDKKYVPIDSKRIISRRTMDTEIEKAEQYFLNEESREHADKDYVPVVSKRFPARIMVDTETEQQEQYLRNEESRWHEDKEYEPVSWKRVAPRRIIDAHEGLENYFRADKFKPHEDKEYIHNEPKLVNPRRMMDIQSRAKSSRWRVNEEYTPAVFKRVLDTPVGGREQYSLADESKRHESKEYVSAGLKRIAPRRIMASYDRMEQYLPDDKYKRHEDKEYDNIGLKRVIQRRRINTQNEGLEQSFQVEKLRRHEEREYNMHPKRFISRRTINAPIHGIEHYLSGKSRWHKDREHDRTAKFNAEELILDKETYDGRAPRTYKWLSESKESTTQIYPKNKRIKDQSYISSLRDDVSVSLEAKFRKGKENLPYSTKPHFISDEAFFDFDGSVPKIKKRNKFKTKSNKQVSLPEYEGNPIFDDEENWYDVPKVKSSEDIPHDLLNLILVKKKEHVVKCLNILRDEKLKAKEDAKAIKISKALLEKDKKKLIEEKQQLKADKSKLFKEKHELIADLQQMHNEIKALKKVKSKVNAYTSVSRKDITNEVNTDFKSLHQLTKPKPTKNEEHLHDIHNDAEDLENRKGKLKKRSSFTFEKEKQDYDGDKIDNSGAHSNEKIATSKKNSKYKFIKEETESNDINKDIGEGLDGNERSLMRLGKEISKKVVIEQNNQRKIIVKHTKEKRNDETVAYTVFVKGEADAEKNGSKPEIQNKKKNNKIVWDTIDSEQEQDSLTDSEKIAKAATKEAEQMKEKNEKRKSSKNFSKLSDSGKNQVKLTQSVKQGKQATGTVEIERQGQVLEKLEPNNKTTELAKSNKKAKETREEAEKVGQGYVAGIVEADKHTIIVGDTSNSRRKQDRLNQSIKNSKESTEETEIVRQGLKKEKNEASIIGNEKFVETNDKGNRQDTLSKSEKKAEANDDGDSSIEARAAMKIRKEKKDKLVKGKEVTTELMTTKTEDTNNMVKGTKKTRGRKETEPQEKVYDSEQKNENGNKTVDVAAPRRNTTRQKRKPSYLRRQLKNKESRHGMRALHNYKLCRPSNTQTRQKSKVKKNKRHVFLI